MRENTKKLNTEIPCVVDLCFLLLFLNCCLLFSSFFFVLNMMFKSDGLLQIGFNERLFVV